MSETWRVLEFKDRPDRSTVRIILPEKYDTAEQARAATTELRKQPNRGVFGIQLEHLLTGSKRR